MAYAMIETPDQTLLNVSALKRTGLGPIDLKLGISERVALMGPSGAGKTLLLRAISDLDSNTAELSLNGQLRESMSGPSWRRRVMFVPANAGWWEDKVGPHFFGADKDVVRNLLHALGLETTALGWEVHHLSTGERQRLALARALAMEPDVLLLDEPTSGLDEENRNLAEALIAKQGDTGRGVLFVTHDDAQAERLGHRTLHIKQGLFVDRASDSTPTRDEVQP